MRRIEGVVLDFDGTLAPGVPELAIAVLQATLERWRPVPAPFLREFYRCVSACRMDQSLEFLLDSLGLSDHLQEVAQALSTAKSWGDWSVDLDPEALRFIGQRPAGKVKIFSAAGAGASRFDSLRRALPPEAFLAYEHCAKSDPQTWRDVATDQGWNASSWVVVDDSPLALWAAKTSGFQTVFRRNSVFTEEDFERYSPWIDGSVGSFAELGRRFRSSGEVR